MGNGKFSTIGQLGEFKGFIKNGLDTSTIIDLVVRFDSAVDFFEKRGFGFPNMFYYHRISRKEVVGVLINTHSYTKKDAVAALDKVVDGFNLQVINRDEKLDQPFEALVETANKKVAKRDPKLKIGWQDVIIIGGFLREKITFVHSADKGFLETCKELGMNAINITRI